MDDREEKKTNKQSYKARKKREYRARRRKREARSKNDDSGSLDNADQGNQPVTREQSEDEETPAAKIEEGEVEKYALIGDFPIPLEYKRMSGERSPSSSSSTSEIGAELNEAMLWRPDHETEVKSFAFTSVFYRPSSPHPGGGEFYWYVIGLGVRHSIVLKKPKNILNLEH